MADDESPANGEPQVPNDSGVDGVDGCDDVADTSRQAHGTTTPASPDLNAESGISITTSNLPNTRLEGQRAAQRLIGRHHAQHQPSQVRLSAERDSVQARAPSGQVNIEGNDLGILQCPPETIRHIDASDSEADESSPLVASQSRLPFLQDQNSDAELSALRRPPRLGLGSDSDEAVDDADIDEGMRRVHTSSISQASSDIMSCESLSSTSTTSGPSSPQFRASRLRRAMKSASRRWQSAAPELRDSDALVDRLLQGELSTEEGLFVKTEDGFVAASDVFKQMSDSEFEPESEEDDQEFEHEAFEILKAIFTKKVEAGKVEYMDKVNFEMMQNADHRNFLKRKADGAVGRKDAAKRNALYKESQHLEVEHRNMIRSIQARQSAEHDRAGAEPRKRPRPRPRQRLATPEMQTDRVLSRYRPSRNAAGPVRIDKPWTPTAKELPGPFVEHNSRQSGGQSRRIDDEETTTEDEPRAKKKRRTRGEMPAPVVSDLNNLRSNIFESARNAGRPVPISHGPNPVFTNPENERALTKFIVSGTEKGPKPKEIKGAGNKLTIQGASRFFHRNNKPKRLEDGTYALARMKAKLLPYQMVGVSFMRWRELATAEPFGGIQADQMGLGKTVMMLAVMADGQPDKAALKRGHRATLIVATKSLLKQWQSEIEKHCHRKFIGKVMRYRTNKNADPETALATMEQHDVILTTYHDVRRSYPRKSYPPGLKTEEEKLAWWTQHLRDRGGPMHQIHFHRVVFDECQEVKNPKGQRYEACLAIKATRRWLMSGTPVIDRPKEVYAYFRLLHKDYTSDLKTFTANYLSRNPKAEERLNLSLAHCIIRRTHDDMLDGKRLLDLPRAQEVKLLCSFSKLEHFIYLQVVRKYEVLISRAIAEGEPPLPFFSRLNAACQKMAVHPLLVQDEIAELPKSIRDRIEELYNEERETDYEEELQRLQQYYGIDPACGLGASYGEHPPFTKYKVALKEGQNAPKSLVNKKCAKCGHAPVDTRCKPCNHFICKTCIDELPARPRQGVIGQCRPCKAAITHLQDIEEDDSFQDEASWPGKNRKRQIPAKYQWAKQGGQQWTSSKTKAVKLKVVSYIAEDPEVKVVIFTQYLGMIDHLKTMCALESWAYTELYGDVSEEDRAENLKNFRENDEIRVLLATTQTGGTGLNLDCASRVILLEPWWNDSRDQQAISRVWRHGQTKEVECVRMYMKGSIDTHKTALSNKKSKAISKMALKGGAEAEVQKYIDLFKPAESEVEKRQGGFVMVGEKLPERSHGSSDDEDEIDDSDTESEAEEDEEPWA